MIHNLNIKECICTWLSKTSNKPPLRVVSIFPVVVHETEMYVLYHYVKNYFSLSTKDEFEKSKLWTEIAFSSPKKPFGDFFHLYCHFC